MESNPFAGSYELNCHFIFSVKWGSSDHLVEFIVNETLYVAHRADRTQSVILSSLPVTYMSKHSTSIITDSHISLSGSHYSPIL